MLLPRGGMGNPFHCHHDEEVHTTCGIIWPNHPQPEDTGCLLTSTARKQPPYPPPDPPAGSRVLASDLLRSRLGLRKRDQQGS
jgi:hypothetical protein